MPRLLLPSRPALRTLTRHRRLVLALLLGAAAALTVNALRAHPGPASEKVVSTDARTSTVTEKLRPGEVAIPLPIPAETADWITVGSQVLLFPHSSNSDLSGDVESGSPSPDSGRFGFGPVRVVAVDVSVAAAMSQANLRTIVVVVRREDAPRLAAYAGGGSLWPALMP